MTVENEQSRVLDFEGFPGRWEITRSAADTDGELFETRWELRDAPGDGPFVHTHPKAEESYEVLDGALEVYADGEWTEVTAGEKHTVPPGTPHTFRNNSPVKLINVHEPALRYEEYFRRFHGLVRDQGVTLPPEDFKSKVLLAMLTMQYEEELRPVSPPKWVFRVLSGLGRLRRYRLPE